MARILSIGSSLQDIYLIDHDDFTPARIGSEAFYSRIPVGAKIEIDRIAYEVGGGAVNSAVTFSRQGHEAVILSSIASDAAGAAILSRLDDENIDSSYMQTLRGSTGCSVILLDKKSGERSVLTHRGVSQSGHYDPSLLDEIQPDYLYTTTIGGDIENLTHLFRRARDLGAKVMFNPGRSELANPKKLLRLLSLVDILLVNKHEAAALVPGVTLTDLLPRLASYVQAVIITDAAMGGIATDGEKTYRFGIYEDIKVKDSTGAGDAFGSGFLARLATGASFKSALTFASANSTFVVSKVGANRAALTGATKLHLMPIQKLD